MKWWLIVCALAACGCLGLDGDSGSSEGGFDETRTLAQGYTPCNDGPDPTTGVVCTPNQYCGWQKYAWCFTGCLSDDNCSTEQICSKKVDHDVGRCIAWDDVAPAELNLEPGYTECGDQRIPDSFAVCQPSQHCQSYRYGICAPGCLSEDNCTENQTCQKTDDNTGICVAIE